MSVGAFELCCQKAGHVGIGQLGRKEICSILLFADHDGFMTKLWKTTRVRYEGGVHTGFVLDVSPVTGMCQVSLLSWQQLSISRKSLDLYDTAIDDTADNIPRALGHITTDWLTYILKGPKYQPEVVDMIKFRVLPRNVTSCPKQRVKYYVDGETITAPKGKPKLLFVKLGTNIVLGGGLSSLAAQLGREKREVYVYNRIVHDYTIPVAPLCFWASYCDATGASVVVLQDIAMRRLMKEKGVASAEDASALGDALATFHERFWDNVPQLSEHFIRPNQSGLIELRAFTDGGSEAFETVLDVLANPAYASKGVVCDALRQLVSEHLPELCKKHFEAAFESQPMSLCHLNLLPEHIAFQGPHGMEPVLFLDWRYANAAPIGLDLAPCLVYCGPEHTAAFFQTYWKILTSTVDPPSVDELRGYAVECLLPHLLMTVCHADEHLQLYSPHFLASDLELWERQTRVHLQRVVKVFRRCVLEGCTSLAADAFDALDAA